MPMEGTSGAIPAGYLGRWAVSPAACTADPVLVEPARIVGGVEECFYDRIGPAAGGGVIAPVSCTSLAGERTDLMRLSLRGDRMTYQSADGARTLERCT